MKKSFLLLIAILSIHVAFAQTRYFSKNVNVSFYSKALFEDIEAHNKTAVSVFDFTSGKIEFSVSIKGFEFRNSLMQEHFNENYLESDKYPKAAFRGISPSLSSTDFSKEGIYKMSVSGSLFLHGVSKDINADVVFIVKDGAISATSEFIITPEDYNIKIPALVRDKIAKSVRVVINIPLLKKI